MKTATALIPRHARSLLPFRAYSELRSLLHSPVTWCQGWEARSSLGEDVDCTDGQAEAYSFDGALYRACPHEEFYSLVMDRAKSVLDGRNVLDWNDDPATTYGDVLKLIEKL